MTLPTRPIPCERIPSRRPMIAEIQKAVAEYYGLAVSDLLARRRPRRLAHPRQLAMWLCLQLTGQSLSAIGERFDRDHTTVLHAGRVVPVRLMLDRAFRKDCHAVIARIDAIRRDNVISFRRPDKPRSGRSADSAITVLADELRRDLPGTLAKILRRTVDGPEIEDR